MRFKHLGTSIFVLLTCIVEHPTQSRFCCLELSIYRGFSLYYYKLSYITEPYLVTFEVDDGGYGGSSLLAT